MHHNNNTYVCIAACAALLAASHATAATAPPRPNILLILADDMGYSDVSPYGSEIYTPNIARLAAQGMMFENFHVGAYCAPTRSMLMTGAETTASASATWSNCWRPTSAASQATKAP